MQKNSNKKLFNAIPCLWVLFVFLFTALLMLLLSFFCLLFTHPSAAILSYEQTTFTSNISYLLKLAI